MPVNNGPADHRNLRRASSRKMNNSCPQTIISQQTGAATAMELTLLATTPPKVLSRKVIEEEITCRL
jgi:hypothetical protein